MVIAYKRPSTDHHFQLQKYFLELKFWDSKGVTLVAALSGTLEIDLFVQSLTSGSSGEALQPSEYSYHR